MSGRPEALFPLFADLTTLPGIGGKTAAALDKAGIVRPIDLALHLPVSVVDRRLSPSARDVTAGQVGTFAAEVTGHSPPTGRGRPYRVTVRDGLGPVQLVFFHAREDYLRRILPLGARRVISGKREIAEGPPSFVHPDHILAEDEAGTLPAFEPVYPLTQGVSQKVMIRAISAVLDGLPPLEEWLDAALLARERWPGWVAALRAAHAPEGPGDLTPEAPARARLAYDEILAHQVTLALARRNMKQAAGQSTDAPGQLWDRVRTSLPYAPTGAQTRAIDEIRQDMAAPRKMNRLLQGDVGAGKTLVAMAALLQAVEAGAQAVMMAPTEVLARQHLMGLRPMAETAGVVIEILTGRDKGRERAAKLEALATGQIQILLGTHAVFQEDVSFQDLRLAVIDEQHRFGVRERMRLGAKGAAVDVLVMTATPIPRSLSLAQYGDMDVSILDEKPPGRSPIKTVLISAGRLDEVVAQLRRALADGQQAYWVCPLVEESEVMDLTAAEDRFCHLRAAFGEGQVALIHGQMPGAEKDAAMASFVSGAARVLVATTVIEVGVDVPTATIMVIERAETFGLAQLHQLRGRVGRGLAASSCLLMYQPPLSPSGERRLQILRQTEDGFAIAEEDLAMRGAGDVIGVAQSGLPRFRVADLERQAGLMAIAQRDARVFLEGDGQLQGARGAAIRQLLWLMEQDKAIRLIAVG